MRSREYIAVTMKSCDLFMLAMKILGFRSQDGCACCSKSRSFFRCTLFFVVIATISRTSVVLFTEKNDFVISIMYLIIYKTIISYKCSDFLLRINDRRFMFLLVNVFLGLTLVQLF